MKTYTGWTSAIIIIVVLIIIIVVISDSIIIRRSGGRWIGLMVCIMIIVDIVRIKIDIIKLGLEKC